MNQLIKSNILSSFVILNKVKDLEQFNMVLSLANFLWVPEVIIPNQ